MFNTCNKIKYNILIVDDDIDLCKALSLELGQSYNVTAVNNAKCAFRELCNKTFDLIIIDIQLPGMDGVELLETINKKYPHIKTIIFTAFPDSHTFRSILKGNADDYLLKFGGPQPLIDAINKLFQPSNN